MNEMDNKWIGKNTIRPDGADKVTGRAEYAADTIMPGMIWGKVLRSPYPHATIKSINTKKAEDLDGVVDTVGGNILSNAIAQTKPKDQHFLLRFCILFPLH